MRITPRQIIPWLPALALALLLVVWSALARWSNEAGGKADAFRRHLQSVRVEKPVLQAIQAERNAISARSDQQKQQGRAYTILEETLRNCGLGNAVRQLKPELRERDVSVEELVHISLTQLDRAQMARFLYETRKAMPEMTVESLNMRRSSGGFMDIDAVFLVIMSK